MLYLEPKDMYAVYRTEDMYAITAVLIIFRFIAYSLHY